MSATPPTIASTPEDLLRAARLRVTQPRLAVMRTLSDHPHASADAVFERVRETLPGTSLQAVYNVLHTLADRGLIRKIEPAGQPGLYELRVGDNHHHVVCTRCGAVADLDCAVGHAPCLTPEQTTGFALVEAEVTFWGVCASCQASV